MVDTFPVGELHVLNAQQGGLKISFDGDPGEVAEIIKNLIRDGYSVLVQDEDGKASRALGFDAETTSYVIKERNKEPQAVAPEYGTCPTCQKVLKRRWDGRLRKHGKCGTVWPIEPKAPKGPKGPAVNTDTSTLVSAGKVRAVAVAPSAGG